MIVELVFLIIALYGQELENIAGTFDRHGLILPPNYGKRIENTNNYLVHASGRISTSIEEEENIKVIDTTGFLRIPEFESKRMNLRVRKDFFHTTAISSVSVPLQVDGVESFEPIDVRSGPNGTFHVQTLVTMPANSSADVIQVSLKDVKLQNNIFLAEEEGFSIISDVDDTIKVSNVLSRLQVMAHTFLLPFTSTEGMPIFYRDLQRDLVVNTSRGYLSNPTFHYLSGTPYQFVGSIQPFLERVYPLGQIISQTFSVDSGGFQGFQDVKPYKIRGAKTILNFFPKRKFILIGDFDILIQGTAPN